MNSAGPKENPYQPPRAPVADFDDMPSRVRPRLINIAVGLIVASLFVGYFNAAQQWDLFREEELFFRYLVSAALLTCATAWIAYRIWQGRSRGRILLVIVLLGVLLSMSKLLLTIGISPGVASVFAVRIVMLLAALVIVFFSPARHWFSRKARSEFRAR